MSAADARTPGSIVTIARSPPNGMTTVVGVRGECPGAGIDGHHRPIASEGEDHRRRRARSGSRADPFDAFVGQRAPHEIAGDVLAQRRCDGGRETEPCRPDRGDRSAAGSAQQLGSEPLLAEPGQRLEPDERQVEEDGCGDDEVDQGRSRISWGRVT